RVRDNTHGRTFSSTERTMRPEGAMKRARGVCLCLAVLLLAGQGGEAQDKDKPKKAPTKEPQFKGKPLSHWTKALKGKDVLARVEALNVLAQAGAEAKPAVPALIGVFRDADAPYLHPLAAVALARVGAPAVPDLQTALKDKVGLVRGGAALALSLM